MWDFPSIVPVITVIGSIGGFAIWLSNQLNKIKDLIFIQIDKINSKIEVLEKSMVSKIEYHERHDDKRFQDVQNQLWEIRLRNASVDEALREAKAKLIKEGKVKIQ